MKTFLSLALAVISAATTAAEDKHVFAHFIVRHSQPPFEG
jgi:methionine-rich copper-binding protein CopC